MPITRSRRKANAIKEGIKDERDVYMLAEGALRNWSYWISSIRSPVPASSPLSLTIFNNMKQEYPAELQSRLLPKIPEAEQCELMICRWCTERDIACFYITFVMGHSYELAAIQMKLRGFKRTNKTNYRDYLNSAMAKLQVAYEIVGENQSIIESRG